MERYKLHGAPLLPLPTPNDEYKNEFSQSSRIIQCSHIVFIRSDNGLAIHSIVTGHEVSVFKHAKL